MKLKLNIFLSLITICLIPFQGIAQIPSPEKIIGFRPGADFHLANYETILSYFRILEKLSPNIRLQEIGQTTEGRPFVIALISSAKNLSQAEHIIQTQKQLSDARKTIGAQARRITRYAMAVVALNCSIHPEEIGPSQMSMELAYRLVTGTSPEIKAILNNVVLILTPAQNPDGLDKVIKWYEYYKGTKFEAGPFPFLTHKYSGQEINRDWFALSQKETALTVENVYNEWRPHIVVDFHQMTSYGPRMFVPPYLDPYDQTIDSITQTEMAALGTNIATDLIVRGNIGVAYHVIFDSFSLSRSYTNHHGGIRILCEIASAKCASPITVSKDFFMKSSDFDPMMRTWNNPMPWKGGTWRLSHIVDYALNTSFSVLEYAARNRQNVLLNAYKVAQHQIQQSEEKSFFLIPSHQHDSYAVYELLTLLKTGLVEIYQAQKPIIVKDSLYPKGVFVIPTNQPFGHYARSLLEASPFPFKKINNTITPRTYDVTTHNLPYLFGVKSIPQKGDIDLDIVKVNTLLPPDGQVHGTTKDNGFFLIYNSNQAYKALQQLYNEPGDLYWLADSINTSQQKLPPGTIWLKNENISLMRQIAKKWHVQIYPANKFSSLHAFKLNKPVIGLYQSHLAPVDEGWTRFILEQYGVEYTILNDRHIKSGNLAKQFDAIIIPDQSVENLVYGASINEMPLKYCGGIGFEGVEQLKKFVSKNGTLILLNSASDLATRFFGLDVGNIVKDLDKNNYYVPGSLLKAIVNTSHPLGYGLPGEIAIFNYNSPVFEITTGESVVHYAPNNILLSGWLTGERHIALKTVVAEIPFENGKLILLGLRPQFRAQTIGTFKLLFNALIKSKAKTVIIP